VTRTLGENTKDIDTDACLVIMGTKTLLIGLASTSILLGLVPGTQALPKWLQPKSDLDDAKFAPREYSIYESAPPAYGGYTYGGYGPAPTISSSSGSGSEVSASTTSGEETSLSSAPTVSGK
jgi:hypothetical protein